MISYNQASQTQKDNFFRLIIVILNLYAREGEKHYRIINNGQNLSVRESSQEPPSASTREILQTIMINLKEMGLLEYTNRSSQVKLVNSTRFFSVPTMCISRVNTELMGELLDIKPEEVPIQIPEYIERHMSNFSPSLQEYVKQCLRENLREEFENNPVTMLLRSIVPSPISLATRLKIPVRLPNAHLGVSNEHYDLEELLSLPEKKDPVTRQPFMLNQIIPAPDILEQIKSRLAARIEPSSTPRP